jgi:hypothetical protein
MEKFEYEGIWWLPGIYNSERQGTLNFDPVRGAWLKVKFPFPNEEFKIVLGIINGMPITLYRLRKHSQFTTIVKADVIFVGIYFEKEEEIIFNSISVNYSNLEEWTAINVFQIEELENEFKITYKPPQRIKAQINDFTLYFDYDFELPEVDIDKIILKHTAFIKIEPNNPLNFNNYLKILNNLQNFLSFAMKKPVYPLLIKGKSEKLKRELSKTMSLNLEKGTITKSEDKYTMYPDIYIYMQLPYVINIEDTNLNFRIPYFLFNLKDIRKNFEIYLRNWFSESESLKRIHNLYFETLYSPYINIESAFLNLLYALEAYHRVSKGGKLSLGERIEDILEEVKGILEQTEKDILKRTENNEIEFIKDLVNTRNFLVHYLEEYEEKAKKGEELFKLTEKIMILLEIIFLKELGMDDESIISLINRFYGTRH